VRLLVDAQLPRRLATALADDGHDAIHTLDLPLRNRTPDSEVTRIADVSDRIVITKDSDFRDGHLVRNSPHRLLYVATGNISNEILLQLFSSSLPAIVQAFENSDYVELRCSELIVVPRKPV
jgi:predicted nuclease of predicted toxin-antitoxin system